MNIRDTLVGEVEKDTRIAIQVSVTRSFDEGQGTTWATTLPQTASLREINGVMDKIWSATSRQARWSRLERIGNEVEHSIKQAAQLQFSLKSLEERHKDMSKAPSDAKSAYTQTKDNIIRFETLIKELHIEHNRMRSELDTE